jgi:aminoglycoside phosphotransferase (APT) family kinase protein
MEIGERVGVGRTAEVYRLGEDRAVKLLLPDFPEALGEQEARIGELVNAAVAAAPRFLGTTRIDGRLGLVYELVTGPTMLDQLTARPWSANRFADELATLHGRIHAVDGSGLPDHRAYLRHMLDQADGVAGAATLAIARQRLAELPDGSAILHGDMHPGNVIEAASGPVAIDWMTARSGPPEADLARTIHLLVGSAIPRTIPRVRRLLISAVRRAFARHYLRAYRRIRPIDPALVLAWRLPVLVARLGERIADEEAGVHTAIDAELQRERTRGR